MGLVWEIAVAMISGVVAVVALAFCAKGYHCLARRRRWRGEVYPASSTVPRRTRHMMRIRVSDADAAAAIARWGKADQLSLAWVRTQGQLRWHQAVIFTFEERAGLVIDPIASLRRRYVFGDSCTVGPSDAVMTFPLGSSSRPRVFQAVRVTDAERSIDLAVDAKDLAAVMGAGSGLTSATGEIGLELREREVARPGLPHPRRARLAGFTDRATVARRAMAAKIERESRARRRVSAVCSVGCMAAIAGINWMSGAAQAHHVAFLHNVTDLDLPLGVSALVYAYRLARPRRRSSSRITD